VVISVASGVTSALLTLIVYYCCAKMICRRCQQRSTVRGHTQGALPLTKKQPATRAAASPDARVAIRAQVAKELQGHVEAAVRLQVDSELKEKDGVNRQLWWTNLELEGEVTRLRKELQGRSADSCASPSFSTPNSRGGGMMAIAASSSFDPAQQRLPYRGDPMATARVLATRAAEIHGSAFLVEDDPYEVARARVADAWSPPRDLTRASQRENAWEAEVALVNENARLARRAECMMQIASSTSPGSVEQAI
jgi:hypothetical protein